MWGLVGGAVAGLLLGTGLLARGRVVRAVEAELSRVSGHRVAIGSASVGIRSLAARDVRIFGAPPFDKEPLARIERLKVRLGGAGGFFSPAEVTAEGVEVEYLSTGDVDNVGRRASGSGSGSRSVGRRPHIRVRDGRLRGTWQPAHGPRVTLRARDFSADIEPDGTRAVIVEGAVAEVTGWMTMSLPELTVQTRRATDPAAAQVRIHAGDGALVVPGGGPLLRGLVLEGTWSPTLTELTLARAAGPRARAAFRADATGAHLTVDVGELALGPLHAWLDARGVLVDGARADLHLEASLEPGRAELPFELDLRAGGIDLQNPSIDRRPWRGLSLDLHASGALDPARRQIKVAQGQLETLGMKVALSGWTDLGETPRGSWTMRTPPGAPLPCAGLLPAQPAPVREALAGLTLTGNLGVMIAVGFDAAAWDALSLEVGLDPLCVVAAEPAALAALLPTLRTGAAPPPGTGKSLPLGKYDDDFAPLSKMPEHLPAAFLTAEDGRFYNHPGFDLEMIRRALAHDLEMRAFAKGGSTITQQLAKNLFLPQSRTLARKLEETVLAWRLDRTVEKKRILELYLNIIELGPNIRGVKQAARAYFGKEIGDLRPIESAHLAAVTPNPHGYARRFRDGLVDDGWLQRLYDLLGMMNRSGRLSRSELSAARSGRLTLRKI
jgi:hypothetical protein